MIVITSDYGRIGPLNWINTGDTHWGLTALSRGWGDWDLVLLQKCEGVKRVAFVSPGRVAVFAR